MRCLLCLVAVAGCTYEEKQYSPPFGCLGDSQGSAAATVAIRGAVVNPTDRMPLAGMNVSLLDRNLNTVDGPITTDATGAFAFSLGTAGAPQTIYISASGADRVSTYQAPPRPLVGDYELSYGVPSTMQGAALALGALGMPFTPGTGTILFNVQDCNGKQVAGASIASMPAGTVRYFDGVQPSMTATQTDAGGVAMVANLPIEPVTLTVTVDGMTYPPRTFMVVADAFMQTVLAP